VSPDSRTSGLHICSCNVSIYCMGLTMVAVKAGFKESLLQALNGINLENVSVSVEQKEVIRNIVLKKDTKFLPALASH